MRHALACFSLLLVKNALAMNDENEIIVKQVNPITGTIRADIQISTNKNKKNKEIAFFQKKQLFTVYKNRLKNGAYVGYVNNVYLEMQFANTLTLREPIVTQTIQKGYYLVPSSSFYIESGTTTKVKKRNINHTVSLYPLINIGYGQISIGNEKLKKKASFEKKNDLFESIQSLYSHEGSMYSGLFLNEVDLLMHIPSFYMGVMASFTPDLIYTAQYGDVDDKNFKGKSLGYEINFYYSTSLLLNFIYSLDLSPNSIKTLLYIGAGWTIPYGYSVNYTLSTTFGAYFDVYSFIIGIKAHARGINTPEDASSYIDLIEPRISIVLGNKIRLF